MGCNQTPERTTMYYREDGTIEENVVETATEEELQEKEESLMDDFQTSKRETDEDFQTRQEDDDFPTYDELFTDGVDKIATEKATEGVKILSKEMTSKMKKGACGLFKKPEIRFSLDTETVEQLEKLVRDQPKEIKEQVKYRIWKQIMQKLAKSGWEIIEGGGNYESYITLSRIGKDSTSKVKNDLGKLPWQMQFKRN